MYVYIWTICVFLFLRQPPVVSVGYNLQPQMQLNPTHYTFKNPP